MFSVIYDLKEIYGIKEKTSLKKVKSSIVSNFKSMIFKFYDSDLSLK